MPIPLNTQLPEFVLPATDGTMISTADENGYKALLVVFTCNHCPYACAYEQRLNDLYNEFSSGGLTMLAINSNNAEEYPEDSFENMIIKKKEAGFRFPYLFDESQEVARSFKASHTPECFLFNSAGTLQYYGKIDDNWREPEKVKNRYLRDAILEILEEKEVSFPETFAIGCTIKWKNP